MGARVMAGASVAVLVALLCGMVSAQSAPPTDCSAAFNNLQPCIEFVNGNTSAPPSAPCCTAFSTTKDQQPVCLCQLLQAFANPATAPGNATRALEIPTLCNVPVDKSRCTALLGLPPTPAPPMATPPVMTPPAVMAPPAGAPMMSNGPSTSPSAPGPATPVATPPPTPSVAPAPATPVATPAASPTASPPAAAGPAGSTVDCSTEFATLQTCFSYVSANDTTPPPPDCCTSLQTVVTGKPVCLCQLLQAVNSGNPATQGINVTRAEDLPSVCNVKADINKCRALLGAPISSPAATAPSTSSPPSPPVAGIIGTPSSPGSPDTAPAPPGSAAPTSLPTPATAFFTAMLAFTASLFFL